MTIIKSYTNLDQSKRLAEILPLESADGFWEFHTEWGEFEDKWEGYEDYPNATPYLEYTRKENEWKEEKQDIPCWSLTPLFDVLPDGTDVTKDKSDTENEKYMCTVLVNDSLVTTFANNPVDVCVEMILKLYKCKML